MCVNHSPLEQMSAEQGGKDRPLVSAMAWFTLPQLMKYACKAIERSQEAGKSWDRLKCIYLPLRANGFQSRPSIRDVDSSDLSLQYDASAQS